MSGRTNLEAASMDNFFEKFCHEMEKMNLLGAGTTARTGESDVCLRV